VSNASGEISGALFEKLPVVGRPGAMLIPGNARESLRKSLFCNGLPRFYQLL